MGTKVQHLPQYAPVKEILRQMREMAGLSQRAFAELVDRSQTFVQYSETGSRRVDFSEFVMWAKACGVNPHVALAHYLSAAYPSDKPTPYPNAQTGKWEAHDQTTLAPLQERDAQVASLLNQAAQLLAPATKGKGKKRAPAKK